MVPSTFAVRRRVSQAEHAVFVGVKLHGGVPARTPVRGARR